METMNGTANGKIVITPSLPESTEPTKTAKRKTRPAESFLNGRVVTRVWANRTPWGQIHWRIDHYCKNEFASGGKQFSLEPGDLQDAMRGLYQAQRWIKKRNGARRSFWSW